MGTLVRALACSVVVSSLFARGAIAQNFYELSQKKGCESVMEPLRNKCIDLNKEKDRVCKTADAGTCEIDKHIAQIAEYKADVARLDAGQIANADTATLRARIEKAKAELDKRKSDAEANEKAARACADARQAIYDFFDDEVIPATERAAVDAKTRRDVLLNDLKQAEGLQSSAKDKRDELAGADPEKDRARWDEYVKVKDEYEKNATAYREAEAKLAEFNRTYGKDIDHDVNGLLIYYKEEQKTHSTEIENQKNRSENCGKVEYMSY
jgi:hypothetical protein